MSRPSKKKASLWGTIGTLVLIAAFYAYEHWQKSKTSDNQSSTRNESSEGGERTARTPRQKRTPREPLRKRTPVAKRDTIRLHNLTQKNDAILRMHNLKAHEKWVEGASIVVKVLPDDLQGSRHQRFLIRISKDVRVKVAHNIDLAPRLPVREGDLVVYRGKYVWNDLGGALHWTHHDPRNRRKGGWLRHEGKVYE